MIRARFAWVFALVLLTSGSSAQTPDFHTDLPRDQAVSGLEFVTAETRALQMDDFANPGLLWVDRGRALFEQSGGKASCMQCHQDRLVGAYTRYPQVDKASGTLLGLDDRVNRCREQQQELPLLPSESDDLLALAMYVAAQSNGMPYDITIDGNARPFFDQGRAYFFQRRGQLNLACNQCHDDNWGKKLRGDTISQGQPTAFPGYRMEWQGAGSLHRRLRDCDVGVRAEPFAIGSEEYKALELYLAWRAGDLPIEVPGVRR